MSSDINTTDTSPEVADVMGMKPNTYCMLMHLSQLLNCCPPFGIIVPIVLWALGKDKNAQIDQHGKIVLNWIISAFIYGMVSAILTIVFVGILCLIVLCCLAIVFPIIGAVKANDGVAWKYPLSITFFK
jgi:uncharacterized Tic20 family protein